MGNRRFVNIYAIYIGDEFVDVGTKRELMGKWGISLGGFDSILDRTKRGLVVKNGMQIYFIEKEKVK